jgi:hypothetical protein
MLRAVALSNAERQRRWRERHGVPRTCPGLPPWDSVGGGGPCGAEHPAPGGAPPALCPRCRRLAERAGLVRLCGAELVAQMARTLNAPAEVVELGRRRRA